MARASTSPTGKRADYSPETRAAAVAALLAGQSVSSVAREYNIPKGTVSDWKRAGEGVGSDPTQKESGASESRASTIGGLLLTLLESNIRGLISASSVLRDQAWVREQGAAELATLIGVTHDKVIRMLEAMDRSSASPSPGTDV